MILFFKWLATSARGFSVSIGKVKMGLMLWLVAVSSLFAAPIEFTEAEGYGPGSLHSQMGWWAWNNDGAGYTVDPSNGKVSLTGKGQVAVFQQVLPAGETVREVRMDFTMGGLGATPGPVWLPSLHLGTLSNRKGDVALQLFRPAGENGTASYQMYLLIDKQASKNGGVERDWGKLLVNTSVGDKGKVADVSDLLRLTLSVTRAGENNWSIQGNLHNVSRDVSLSEVQLENIELSDEYRLNDLYASFRSGTPESFEVESFEIVTLDFSGETVLSEIKSSEGYPLWAGPQSVAAAAELPILKNVRFSVIKPYHPEVDGYRWHHGASLAFHNDRLYASYGVNPYSENVAGAACLYQVSDDLGVTWSSPKLIDSGSVEEKNGVGFGVLLSENGVLWSFNTGHGETHKDDSHFRIYRFDDSTSSWEFIRRVDQPFFPNQEPQRLDNGNWMMCGVYMSGDGAPAAVAISHGDDLTQWEVVPIPKVQHSWMFGECATYIDGSNLLNIARYDQTTRRALVAFSKDFGKSWTASEMSNLPMTGSMPAGGTLSSGHRYLIATIAGDSYKIKRQFWDRTPLSIAVAEPGKEAFSKVSVIRHAVFPEGPGESSPNGRLAYPCAVEHDKHLFVAYSNNGDREHNFNSIELAVIPLDSLINGHRSVVCLGTETGR